MGRPGRGSRATRRKAASIALALALAGCGGGGRQRTLSIAAASDLQFAMEEIVRGFRAAHPDVDVQVAYGSSGNFYAQIPNGAPFDLFLSADVDYARRLAPADSVFVYAVGRIVVWAPVSSAVELRMSALAGDAVKHVAIANPQHAPYGRAAEAALRSAGVWDAVKPKLVLGENIAQTLEFVESGAADVGIVALSLALAPAARDRGRYWEVPLEMYPRIEQGGAILPRARDRELARAFRDYMMSGGGAAVLRRYGFSPGR